jgi:hypothetical protein
MSWYKQAEDYQKMRDWFDKRTNKHIELVQKYCKKIEEYDESFEGMGLLEQAANHDQTKFKDPEVDPYVYITWQYKCKEDGMKFEAPKDIDDKMNEATNHHVLHNRHHPEFHCGKKVDVINREDRDKPPEEMIDAIEMSAVDIAEMVADWFAMSEEKNTNPKDWADKNVNVRWKFTNKQKDLIYELIENVWE